MLVVSTAWVGVRLSLMTTAEAGVATAAMPARAVAPRKALRTRASWRRLVFVITIPCSGDPRVAVRFNLARFSVAWVPQRGNIRQKTQETQVHSSRESRRI